MASERIGVVVGLHAEARLARGLGGPVAIGGGTAAGAAAAARSLVATGATALLSFGLAGGLDPALRPGALVVPAIVLCGGVAYRTNPAVRQWLAALGALPLEGGEAAVLLGAEAIAATAAEKRRLFAATGAAAIDLESGMVARVAAAHALPFAVLRAICDPAGRDLPPAALIALDRAGTITPLRIAASLIRHPGQLGGMLALAGDAARARRALRDACLVARAGGS